MIELKPCPFCGGTAEMVQRGDHGKFCIIKCEMCGCALETGEEDDLCGDLWNDSMESRHISQLEAQLQEADATATAMGLALTEARMENDRLREVLKDSGWALERAYEEGVDVTLGRNGSHWKQGKADWISRRDDVLANTVGKEGA